MINRAKVLITRSEMQGKELAALLAEKQIESVEFPVLKIDKPTGVLLDSLNEAVIHYNDYDWIVFTSVNGVHAFFERLRSLRLPISEINFAKFAAVGPSTKKAIESYGCHVNIVPDRLYQAEGLIESLLEACVAGERLLLARGNLARDILPKSLVEAGLVVDDVVAYMTVIPEDLDSLTIKVCRTLERGEIRVVTFTSSSTVHHFMDIMSKVGYSSPVTLLKQCQIVCIGPLTAETVKQYGLTVTAIPNKATIEQLTNKIIEIYGGGA